jgi:hypothetical protein
MLEDDRLLHKLDDFDEERPVMNMPRKQGASSGKDFTKQTDGRIVEYTSVDGKATFKVRHTPAAGSLYWGLHDVACGAIDPMEKHRTFSGRVADYNIGTPRKGVPIFLAIDDKPPVMVAVSGADGIFSFRIYQTDDALKPPGYLLAKGFKEAWLCVGNLGLPTFGRSELPAIGDPLPTGSETSQYPITDILK